MPLCMQRIIGDLKMIAESGKEKSLHLVLFAFEKVVVVGEVYFYNVASIFIGTKMKQTSIATTSKDT